MNKKRIYRTNKGVMIDMESMRATNEKTVATGNMRVNAKGDLLKGGKVVAPVKERTSAHYAARKVQSAKGSIKSPIKKADTIVESPTTVDPVVNNRARPDGSTFKEIVYPDGAIEVVELTPPTVPKRGPRGKKASV